jgi:hypothetical protein
MNKAITDLPRRIKTAFYYKNRKLIKTENTEIRYNYLNKQAQTALNKGTI